MLLDIVNGHGGNGRAHRPHRHEFGELPPPDLGVIRFKGQLAVEKKSQGGAGNAARDIGELDVNPQSRVG